MIGISKAIKKQLLIICIILILTAFISQSASVSGVSESSNPVNIQHISTLRAFKAGARATGISSRAAEILARITDKLGGFGGRAADILRRTKSFSRIDILTDEAAEMGAGRLAGYLDDPARFDEVVEGVGDINKQKQFFARLESIGKTHDNLAKSLSNSNIGRKMILEWDDGLLEQVKRLNNGLDGIRINSMTSRLDILFSRHGEERMKQFFSILEKVSDNGINKIVDVNRVGLLENFVSNENLVGAVYHIKDVRGADDLITTIFNNPTRYNGIASGFEYQARRTYFIQLEGNEIISIEDNLLGGHRKFDLVFQKLDNTKILEEITTKTGSNLNNQREIERLVEKINAMGQAVRENIVDEAQFVFREEVVNIHPDIMNVLNNNNIRIIGGWSL